MKHAGILCGLALALASSVPAAHAGTTPTAPRLRAPETAADREYSRALDRIAARAEAHRGDPAFLLDGIAPYGPLDLHADPARATPAQASRARNRGAGRAAAAIGMSKRRLLRHVQAARCGDDACVAARWLGLNARLGEIQRLVQRFLWLEHAGVIAAWPDDGFRVGHLAYHDGTLHRIVASPLLGFIPWDERALDPADPSPWRELRADRETIVRLVRDLRRLGLVAIVRDGGAIRAIAAGSLLEHQVGVLFLAPGTGRPAAGQQLRNGLVLTGLRRLADGVYLYASR